MRKAKQCMEIGTREFVVMNDIDRADFMNHIIRHRGLQDCYKNHLPQRLAYGMDGCMTYSMIAR